MLEFIKLLFANKEGVMENLKPLYFQKRFFLLLIFGKLYLKIQIIKQNTSVSLGNYFEDFVENKIAAGRYKNASEVICSGLRLLEEEENKIAALKNALQDGIDSGLAKSFNPIKHLNDLNASKKKWLNV
jgi:antitoxin ParD1/3/4